MRTVTKCNGKNVKQSRNRSGVAQRVPESLGSQISLHSAREGCEVFSLTHRPPLSPGMFLVLVFTRGWDNHEAMVRSEGNMSLKNPVTPPGIDTGTVWVAQRLNHYATPGPQVSRSWSINWLPVYPDTFYEMVVVAVTAQQELLWIREEMDWYSCVRFCRNCLCRYCSTINEFIISVTFSCQSVVLYFGPCYMLHDCVSVTHLTLWTLRITWTNT